MPDLTITIKMTIANSFLSLGSLHIVAGSFFSGLTNSINTTTAYLAQNALLLVGIFLLTICIYFILATLGKVAAGYTAMIRKMEASDKSIKLAISEAVQEKFITITPESQSFVELAVEVWRLSKRLKKAQGDLGDDQNKALQNSLSKLERFLTNNDLEVKEYTDQKYNQGMNLDVLSIEKDPAVEQSVIKETVEPAIMHRGQIIKRAKVIIVER